MSRRVRVCYGKIAVIFGVLLSVFAVFRFQDEIADHSHWLLQRSFPHHYTTPNSSLSSLYDSMDQSYPYPYKFLINQPKKCHQRKPFLVLLVIVESHDVVSRNIIRETWGDENNYKDVEVVRLFLVGQSPAFTGAIQKLLKEESTIYGDIIQQDFLDTYRNLTLKTLMGMEWVSKFCPHASYVMKVDGDVFLNLDYAIYKLLHPELPVRQNFLMGYVVSNGTPNRNKLNKWFVPKELYPDNSFPPYPAGPGYLFSADMAKKIYDVAQKIAVISVEDVFMGICLDILKISATKLPQNAYQGEWIGYDPHKFCNFVLVHHYVKDDLRKVWLDFWAKKTMMCTAKN